MHSKKLRPKLHVQATKVAQAEENRSQHCLLPIRISIQKSKYGLISIPSFKSDHNSTINVKRRYSILHASFGHAFLFSN